MLQRRGRMDLSPADLQALRAAKRVLERPGLAIRLTNLLGAPVEKAITWLPARWSDTVHDATLRSLRAALRLAVMTLDPAARARSADGLHKLLVVATGAGGGYLGLPALPLELPVSTTIILRSIADVARSEGEDLHDVRARLACLEVFALGGRPRSDDAAETGYFAVRTALARAMSEAAEFIVRRGAIEETAPALVRLIAAIASRFGIAVSDKVAAQAVPIIGAAGGALVNAVFIDHFQDMARGHFTVRRLERSYGADLVRRAYARL